MGRINMSESIVLEERKHRNSKLPIQGDLYVKGWSVYRVSAVNETDDKVLLATTNDIIQSFGQVKRLELRKKGYYHCPLNLQEAAIQVFELDEKFTTKTLEKLCKHRLYNHKIFDKLGLDNDIMYLLFIIHYVALQNKQFIAETFVLYNFTQLENEYVSFAI